MWVGVFECQNIFRPCSVPRFLPSPREQARATTTLPAMKPLTTLAVAGVATAFLSGKPTTVTAAAAAAAAAASEDMDKLFQELALLRDLAIAQNRQMEQLHSVLKPEQRRKLAGSSGGLLQDPPASAGSGIRIKSANAQVVLGAHGDVVYRRVGDGQAHMTNTTRFDKIRVNSTDDILIGDCTLTQVLLSECDGTPTLPPKTTTTTTTTTTTSTTTTTTPGVYPSCLQLLTNHPSLAGSDGTYTLVTADGTEEYEAYCDMTTDGGGWTLAAKMTNADEKHWVTGTAAWTNTTAFGDTSDLGEGSDARGLAWSNVPTAQFMIRDSENGYDYLMTEANSGCFLTESITTTLASGATVGDNRHSTMSEYWKRALLGFPGYDLANTDTCQYYERCSATGTYNPAFLSSADAYSQTQIGSGDITYLTMAFSDVNADTAGVISGLESANYCPEADIAIGALEDGTVWLPGASNKGYQQDIGGPTQCNYDDDTCQEDYPETVFFFVREETDDLIRGSSCLDIVEKYPDTHGQDGQYVLTSTGFCEVVVRDDEHAFGASYNGMYFHFWNHEVARCIDTPVFSELTATVQHWRRGELLWTGKVVLWDSSNGGRVGDGHGRRDDGTAAAGQFENGDIIVLKYDLLNDRPLSDTRSYGAYCDMSTGGGGWTLAAKMSNQDGKHWVNNAKSWSSTRAYGDTATLASGNDAKGEAWNSIPASQIMLKDDESPDDFVMTTNSSRCFQNTNMADYFEAALGQGFPGYDEATNALRGACGFYERCPVIATYEPDWLVLTSSTTYAQDPLSYITIAYTDADGDTSAVLSGLNDACGEADVGLGALEDGALWLEDSSNPTYQQDIGGPTYVKGIARMLIVAGHV